MKRLRWILSVALPALVAWFFSQGQDPFAGPTTPAPPLPDDHWPDGDDTSFTPSTGAPPTNRTGGASRFDA